MPAGTAKLTYEIDGSPQVSWYVPPRSPEANDTVPDRLWIFFGGNASLALYWSGHVKLAPDDEAGFLLFDYPGYGDSAGNPHPDTIRAASEAALDALAQHLRVDKERLLDQKIRVLGHSLGAAVAADFATRHQVDRLVMAAPFTTMRAMADRIVKPHLSWLLRHNLSNFDSLEALAQDDARPRVIIAHGTADGAVPPEMSRELHSRWPDMIDYIEVPNADHATVLDNITLLMADELPAEISSFDDVKPDVTTSDSNTETTAPVGGADH